MDITDAVSETALVTLRARAIESQRARPLIDDPVGVELLGLLEQRLADDTRKRILHRRLPTALSVHLALRGRQYDRYVERFRSEHENALVVSLGAGFDTRYFRISDEPWPYVEVDLTDVIAAKKELLGERAGYTMIGCSVLEDAWLEEVRAMQREHVLFLAEGLFMYLPRQSVVDLFGKLASSFTRCEIVFEVVREKYTRGIWKRMVDSKMKRSMGTKSAATYESGVRTAREVESYANGIEVVEEWSYLEADDIRPSFMRLFRHLKSMTRSQWTIRATIGWSLMTPPDSAQSSKAASPASPVAPGEVLG
ncbi:MAG: class I SAM-dependent methyltransferase [Deltaproteobacteria bacterium]|nr:class I SAM-dependent methyltransferase [Deltaproteobacteria bacterium]